MKKKNSDFRLSADSEMEKEEKKVEKGGFIIAIVITVLVGIALAITTLTGIAEVIKAFLC